MPCNWSLDWEGKEKERRKHARKHLFDLVKPGNWRCLIINQQVKGQPLVIVMVESQVSNFTSFSSVEGLLQFKRKDTIVYHDGSGTNEGPNCLQVQFLPSPPSS